MSFILSPLETDVSTEKRGGKKDSIQADGLGGVKMFLTLLANVIVLYMQASIVQVGVLSLKESILGYGVCFALFLAFNK